MAKIYNQLHASDNQRNENQTRLKFATVLPLTEVNPEISTDSRKIFQEEFRDSHKFIK